MSSTTGQKAETFGIFSDSDQELHQDLPTVNPPHLVEKIGGFDVETHIRQMGAKFSTNSKKLKTLTVFRSTSEALLSDCIANLPLFN